MLRPRLRRSLLLLAGLLTATLAPQPTAGAQATTVPVLAPPAPGKIQRLTLKDGSQLLGKIVSVDSSTVRFESAIGLTSIPIASIVSVSEETPGETHGGRYYFPNPNATRLIFAPTGRMLKKGQGYFNDFWIFFPAVVQGVTDRVTIGGGMSIFPGVALGDQLYFVTPKVGVLQSETANIAVGALALFLPADVDENGNAGVVYGVGTWGSPDKSFTAGLGYGYLGGTLSNSPVLMLGGENRVSPGVAFVTENYVFTEAHGLLSLGVRFMGKNLSVDLAVTRPFGYGESVTIPLLGFMWRW